MNGFLLMFCFLLPSALAHGDKKQVPNPADYTLNAEVVESYSRLQTVGGFPANVQVLDVQLDGKRLELTSANPTTGVLALATYKSRPLPAGGYKGAGSYDTFTNYQFLLPDGHTRDYTVTGIIADSRNSPVPTN